MGARAEETSVSDIPHNQRDALAKAWQLLNLQADTMLKWEQRANAEAAGRFKARQTQTEVCKVVVTAMGAGAALLTAGGAIGAILVHLVR